MFVIPVKVGLYICIESVEYVLALYVLLKMFRVGRTDAIWLHSVGWFSFDVSDAELKSVLACLRLSYSCACSGLFVFFLVTFVGTLYFSLKTTTTMCIIWLAWWTKKNNNNGILSFKSSNSRILHCDQSQRSAVIYFSIMTLYCIIDRCPKEVISYIAVLVSPHLKSLISLHTLSSQIIKYYQLKSNQTVMSFHLLYCIYYIITVFLDC